MNHSIHLTKSAVYESAVIPLQMCLMGNIRVANVNRVTTAKPYVDFMPSHSGVATGFPGYNSIIPKDAATVGEILKENGYATSWFGKNHNTPSFVASQAGPFDQWPIGMGFEYFYGFVGGDTSQWQPNLFRNTTAIYPYLNNPKWNLTTAMADDAIAWMNQINSIDPSKPFFVYYVPGGTHAPHHPTPEWIEKISGMLVSPEFFTVLGVQPAVGAGSMRRKSGLRL